MPADRKIDYLELPARDLDAVQAFYAQAFGWTFTDYGPDYRAFTDGRLVGHAVIATGRQSKEGDMDIGDRNSLSMAYPTWVACGLILRTHDQAAAE